MVDSQVLQDRSQPHHVLARLVGAAKLGFAHDLHQGHTSAVEVHERALRLVDGALVEQLAGVLLQMGPRDAAAPRLAIDLELEVALAAERQVVLRDLVTLGQVRIEVVLTVELREFRDLAAERQPGPDGLLHGAHIGSHIALPLTQVQNRVSHKLPRAVIRYVAAAVRRVKRDTRAAQNLLARKQIFHAAVAPQRDHVRVFQQQQMVRDQPLLAILGKHALQFQRAAVIDASQFAQHKSTH